MSQSEIEKSVVQTFLGLHLAGPNSEKSAIVAMKKNTYNRYVILEAHEKIGSFGNLYSDDRILSIVEGLSPNSNIFTDAPLGAPPCVTCQLEACPGTSECDDVSVAYLLSLTNKFRELKKPRKKKPFNPQSHRVWDALNLIDGVPFSQEPSYSANRSPLYFRASVFRKRLAGLDASYSLKEASVLKSLFALLNYCSNFTQSEFFDSSLDFTSYKSFELGREVRSHILEIFIEASLVDLSQTHQVMLEKNLQLFNAYICSLVACLFAENKTTYPPEEFRGIDNWVYSPSFDK